MHTEEDDMAIEFVLRRFGSRGEVRCRPFASGRVVEDVLITQSHYTGALSLYVECRSRIAWRTFVPLREKRLFQFHKDQLWAKLIAGIVERRVFLFILSPVVCV